MDFDILDRLYAMCNSMEKAIEKTSSAWDEAAAEIKKASSVNETFEEEKRFE
jgi:hypothetical protein